MCYDALNRLTRIATDDPAEPDVILGYDDPSAEYGIGRLTSVTDGAGVTTYDYHPSGEVKRETRSVDGETHILSYSYDGAGQIDTITYPSGRVVTYQRDSAGRVEQVTTEKDGTSTTLAIQIERAPFGPITSLTRGNGLTETRTLDQAYQVDAITVPGILERDVGHTVDANVATIDDLLQSARHQAFGYDAADRLTAATGGYGALGFEYDHNANRTARISDGQRHRYQVNRSNNWLLEAETLSYQHDAAGNLVQRGQDSFVYDSHHRLIEATVDGTTATYAYNVHHQRTEKRVGGTTTRFFYGPGGELLSEMVVGAGLGPNEIVWLDGTPLAYLTDDAIYHIHVDHLGTPQVLTDATGAIAWEAHYRPFGDAITSGSLTFNQRFPGQYHDAETGLHYNWHRYYDPQTGRYLTSDPIGLVGGLNPYAYAHGNPIANTDPTGEIVPALVGAYVAVDVALTAWDLYDTYRIFTDECATTNEKWVSGGMLAAGIVLPGRYGWADDLVRSSGSHGQLRNAGLADSHHIIQDAAMKNIPGYNRMNAPAVQLRGPSTLKGSEHYIATQIQRQRGGGTYGSERRIAYKALRKAGVGNVDARRYIEQADNYFLGELGISPSTPVRTVRNRR